MSDSINAVHSIKPPAGYPHVNFERAYQVCMEGSPLAGHFEFSFESVRQHNFYNNHLGLDLEMDNVRAKLAKEEAQSFHIALP